MEIDHSGYLKARPGNMLLLLYLLCTAGFVSLAAGQGNYVSRGICGNLNRTCISGEAACVGDRCVCGPQFHWGKGEFACYPKRNYVSRGICGNLNRTCISGEASCVGDRCVCGPQFHWGKGEFACYPKTTVACEIKNDPSLKTFAKEEKPFPFPCRYLAADVRSALLSGNGSNIGYCEARVWAYNSKSKGKYFVSGFDLGIKMYTSLFGGFEVINYSYRLAATASNNVNSMTQFGRTGQSYPFVVGGDELIRLDFVDYNVGFRFDFDSNNNRYIVRPTGCGIDINFVPYDTTLRMSQKQVPGLSIAVSETNSPQFRNQNNAMCLAPSAYGGLSLSGITAAPMTEEQALVLRAFTSSQPQNQPDSDNGQCNAVRSVLTGCQSQRQKQAMVNCYWMFAEPRCVESWCQNQPCTSAISAIQTAGCNNVENVSELTPFMAGSMCPNSAPIT
ncbi:hypothetical protein PoB_005272700 [Plakobranchus ocellatus]|uniref:VWFD domain-containing protein n=1 Tax=Plakobranchus ocellatus TaxID=259542 RepID=A0AAV4C4I7_9GAST|nr:hypothetical protein PoB_005272700 [Plakobranchus ocellatus]